ncbi:hypothetical protein BKA63DRAFT_486992 [Paraphoma chrysanthemicola]|nr:hypothetical protein BKA63DRAFT_486992 [Paraphoma chrysanthemicola]
MASSTSVKQTSSQKCPSFSALPPEIRISIYQCIIYSSANRPDHEAKFWHLHDFFLLSGAIMYEFEHEWVKVHNKRINVLLAEWPLHMGSTLAPVHLSNLADTKHIQILLSGATSRSTRSLETRKSRFASTIGAFTMKPMGWPNLPDNSIRTFFTSRMFREMLHMRAVLRNMPRYSRFQVSMDYCRAEINCTPRSDVDEFMVTTRRHWLFLPCEILFHIFSHVVNSCQSIEDLHEWREMLESCPRANNAFENFLHAHFFGGYTTYERRYWGYPYQMSTNTRRRR